MAIVRLLGQVDVLDYQGQTSRPASPLRRSILALLALRRGRPIDAHMLLDQAWNANPPSSQLRALRFHISQLRREVGVADLIATGTSSYALGEHIEVDVSQLDAAARNSKLTVDEVNGLLKLWRGRPFSDAAPCEALEREAVRLAETRLGLQERFFHAQVLRRRSSRHLDELTRLSLEHPVRERLWASLISAHHEAGHRAEALSAFDRLSMNLIEALGVEPSAELRLLARDIRENAMPAGFATSTEADGSRHARRSPVRLRPATSFVGRDESVAELARLVRAHGLVTVHGPGGVGKSRLSVEVADAISGEFDHVHVVELSGATSESDLWRVIVDEIGLIVSPSMDEEGAIINALGVSSTLLVLDNCEHLTSHVARLVNKLIALNKLATKKHLLRILATSRSPLRTDVEWLMALGPLSLDIGTSAVSPAAQMFCDRAGSNVAQLSDQDRANVGEICQRLDGMPLAIELAAGRLRALNVADLLDSLDDRFSILARGAHTGPEHHQTLRAAVAWSVDPLPPVTQDVLTVCSTFAGRFTIADVGALGAALKNGRESVHASIADLVDVNLIVREPGDTPYRLMQTIRAFGQERLADDGLTARAASEHARYFSIKARGLAEFAFGPEERHSLYSALAQTAEYRIAIEQSVSNEDWEVFCTLVESLAATTFWLRGAWLEMPRRIAELAVNVPNDAPKQWSSVLAVAACFLWNRGWASEAEEHIQSGLGIDAANPLLWIQGAYAIRSSDLKGAVSRAEEAVRLSTASHRAGELIQGLSALMYLARKVDPDLSSDAAHHLLTTGQQLASQTAQARAEIGFAMLAEPGTRVAAAHAARAADLTADGRSPRGHLDATRLQIEHLLGFDMSEAKALLTVLADRTQSDPDPVNASIVAAAGAVYLARNGNADLAIHVANAASRIINYGNYLEASLLNRRETDAVGPSGMNELTPHGAIGIILDELR